MNTEQLDTLKLLSKRLRDYALLRRETIERLVSVEPSFAASRDRWLEDVATEVKTADILDQIVTEHEPMTPQHQSALWREVKQLRRDRQRLGRYAVENRQLKRKLRAAEAQVAGYKQQAEAALRVMEELKTKIK